MSQDKVVDYLLESVEVRKQRNETYGEDKFGGAYKQHGHVMAALFPAGIALKSIEDFNRYGVLNMIVSKLIRECANFNESGHEDSMRDLSVYAAMMRELDYLQRPKEAGAANENSSHHTNK